MWWINKVSSVPLCGFEKNAGDLAKFDQLVNEVRSMPNDQLRTVARSFAHFLALSNSVRLNFRVGVYVYSPVTFKASSVLGTKLLALFRVVVAVVGGNQSPSPEIARHVELTRLNTGSVVERGTPYFCAPQNYYTATTIHVGGGR